MNTQSVQNHLRTLSNPEIAAHSQLFFKAIEGGYGEGDRFLGIRVPVLRAQVTRFADLPFDELGSLIKSPFHEERLFALLLLVHRFARSDDQHRKMLYEFYLANTAHINNWDLVDCSAHKIIGAYLEDKSRKPLYRLAKSASLWERRVAIISTLHFIKADDFSDTLAISAVLLTDDEDLIHKAVGWMLREVGKREPGTAEVFLKEHYHLMPRTMLRYAIERLAPEKRQAYLTGTLPSSGKRVAVKRRRRS